MLWLAPEAWPATRHGTSTSARRSRATVDREKKLQPNRASAMITPGNPTNTELTSTAIAMSGQWSWSMRCQRVGSSAVPGNHLPVELRQLAKEL
jgi:hypothetical protein